MTNTSTEPRLHKELYECNETKINVIPNNLIMLTKKSIVLVFFKLYAFILLTSTLVPGISCSVRPFHTVARKRERTCEVRSRFYSFVLLPHTLNENEPLSFALLTEKHPRKTKHSPNSHITMGNTQPNRNPSSVSQCFDSVTHEFSLDSYFKLRRKREIEKQEDDVFYETSIELHTQSPEKRK